MSEVGTLTNAAVSRKEKLKALRSKQNQSVHGPPDKRANLEDGSQLPKLVI